MYIKKNSGHITTTTTTTTTTTSINPYPANVGNRVSS
jgi:hypothetical protein